MKTFIDQIKNNQSLKNAQFAVRELSHKNTKNGNAYINIILSDKTGEINAKIWQDSLTFCENFKSGDVVNIEAQVIEYQKELQLIISSLKVEKQYDKADFVKSGGLDTEKLFQKIQAHVKSVKNQYLKELLELFFKDKDFVTEFKIAPGAQIIHHAYLGGLMQHKLEMLNLSDTLKLDFRDLDMDLLKTGILLHDIGKMKELSVTTIFSRTTPGHLIGHIYISASAVDEKISTVKRFPQELRNLLLHLILSHHGRLEFGSPVTPMISEAFALHYLDQLSSKLNIAVNVTHETRQRGEEFSARNFALENSLYVTPKQDDENKKKEQTLF